MSEEKAREAHPPVLVLSTPDKSGVDYEFVAEADHCWITVGNLSVAIRSVDEGAKVSFYPYGYEEDGPIMELTCAFELAQTLLSIKNKEDEGRKDKK